MTFRCRRRRFSRRRSKLRDSLLPSLLDVDDRLTGNFTVVEAFGEVSEFGQRALGADMHADAVGGG